MCISIDVDFLLLLVLQHTRGPFGKESHGDDLTEPEPQRGRTRGTPARRRGTRRLGVRPAQGCDSTGGSPRARARTAEAQPYRTNKCDGRALLAFLRYQDYCEPSSLPAADLNFIQFRPKQFRFFVLSSRGGLALCTHFCAQLVLENKHMIPSSR